MKKLVTSALIMMVVLVAACAPDTTPAATPGEEAPLEREEALEIVFWAAPNPPQEAFWSEMADMYREANPNVMIEVSSMPESPTSEAGIQAAIAGGTAPVASENIFVGFGSELYRSEAVVPLNEMEGWQALLEDRSMEESIQSWQFDDGNYYILPIYSNAMLFGWRIDILSEIGYEEAPVTYSEIMEMGDALNEVYPDKFYWARAALTDPTWWERWFDFFMLYDAASGGQALITGDEVTADDDAAIQVLTFLQNLSENDLLLTQESQHPFETGLSVSGQLGPWTFPTWEEQFPELVYGETFGLTMPPRPEGTEGDVKTFADAKGLVFYRQASAEEREAMWDFIRWVFADPAHDLAWLERTTLPPVRDDLSTNETFQTFFENNPALVPYAENIPNAVPPLAHPEYTQIQRLLGEEAVVPVVNGDKDPEAAWNDWKEAVQPVLGQ